MLLVKADAESLALPPLLPIIRREALTRLRWLPRSRFVRAHRKSSTTSTILSTGPRLSTSPGVRGLSWSNRLPPPPPLSPPPRTTQAHARGGGRAIFG